MAGIEVKSDDPLFYRHATPKGRRRTGKSKKEEKAEKRRKKKLEEMQIAVYLRKSSEEEEKQFNSTTDQKDKCLEFVRHIEEDRGIKLHIAQIFEEHRSAAHAGKRDEFNKMLEGVRSGKFDAILAYHPDRLSRNMLEAGILLDMIRPERGEEVGVLQDMLFPTVSFSNDSGGRLMLAVLFSMATQYSDHLSEVVQRGVNSTVARGKSPGTPKWGYTWDKVTRYYIPDENSFDIIRKGWEMFLSGESQAAILAYWKDEDIHYNTIEGANKKSRKINIKHDTQVGRIFRDPFYYGILNYGESRIDLRTIPEANFEPMITEEEYNKAQQILDAGYQKHRKSKEPEVFVPFQGMLFCKECGHKLYGYANKKRHLIYYGHQSKSARLECERLKDKTATKEIRGQVILENIYKALDTIRPTKKDYEHYLKVAKNYTEDKRTELENELASKRGALSQYKRDLDKEIENYQASVRQEKVNQVVVDACNAKIASLEGDVRRLDKDIKDLTEKTNRPEQVLLTEEEFLNMLKNLPQQIRKADFVGKDILLRNIFLNIQIDKKNEAFFLCKPEFDGLIKCNTIHTGGDIWT